MRVLIHRSDITEWFICEDDGGEQEASYITAMLTSGLDTQIHRLDSEKPMMVNKDRLLFSACSGLASFVL